jgi:hypothetical protein
MIQNMIDQPWTSLGMLVVLILLYTAAAFRVHRDRNLKARAPIDRRNASRDGRDRRWQPRKM